MDVNAGIGTRAFSNIGFYDKRIHAIYPITFAFWIGDLYLDYEKENRKL